MSSLENFIDKRKWRSTSPKYIYKYVRFRQSSNNKYKESVKNEKNWKRNIRNNK